MIHLPLLRSGRPYQSLATREVVDFRSGEPLAVVSQANPGLISLDLASVERSRKALEAVPVSELLNICQKAAGIFTRDNLPLGETSQSPEDYIRQLSSTTGMPHALCRKNMQKIRGILENMPDVLSGLTRGLPPEILEKGWIQDDGRNISFVRQTEALGAVLPSNSPGVHTLWIPSIPLRTPLALKPGSEEPWTPYRVAQALISAGCPSEAFHYYPTDYAGAAEILMGSGRSMVFGDESTVSAWRGDSRVQIHGPGYSKVIIGQDQIDSWQDYLDVMVNSIASNGGRSCINASGIWVPSRGKEIADALARKLAEIQARSMEDPEAEIAAFTRPAVARRFSQMIDSHLKDSGAEDVTRSVRGSDRVMEFEGCTFLLPTLIRCPKPDHPLANTEFLFPFASVVEVPQEEFLQRIGPTLVLTLITEDRTLLQDFASSPLVDRLNAGPMATNEISWDQPHEGNLFEHLFRQRAFQQAAAS